ncbi:MAG: amidohydrolase 2 [Acidimicrobiales bacterium]|jgi:predicted TIM-barrel fold metal-dependent hydrolase|nr:amidohydrolase 2 [Acidimicrobiales bacterium]
MTLEDTAEWLISVDDHVLEPSHVWQERVPTKYRDAAPRLVRDDEGEAWVYEGKRMVTPGLGAVAGKAREEFSFEPITYDEMRPGCYDSVARLEDMNRAGVIASLCFPSFPRFCGQVFYEAKDRELALLCVQAYNDWMIDEWCGRAPGRYIPLTLVPLWDPTLAAAEVRRTAAKGSRAITFSENPALLGLPTIHNRDGHWDPLMRACEETESVICIHIGSSSQRYTMSDESPMLVTMSWSPPLMIAGAMIEWIFSPIVQKFPGIKVALAEGGIGWMPYFLEKCAQVVDKHRYWIASGDVKHDSLRGHVEVIHEAAVDLDGFSVSETFRRHIYGCFIDDVHGIRNLDVIGVDNVMIEADYPHSDSTWPNCIGHAQKQLAGLSDEHRYKIMRGNAERLFRFTPAPIPM